MEKAFFLAKTKIALKRQHAEDTIHTIFKAGQTNKNQILIILLFFTWMDFFKGTGTTQLLGL